MDEFFEMSRDLFVIIVGTIVFVVFCVCLVKLYYMKSRRERLEKKITDHLSYEGFTWEKKEGSLIVRRNGVDYRVILADEPIAPILLWVQLGTELEGLHDMHWIGRVVLVNVLSDRHPGLNVSVNVDDCALWVHYRADIRNTKEFAHHFRQATDDMQSLAKDYKEVMPRLLADFPIESKNDKTPIGFS